MCSKLRRFSTVSARKRICVEVSGTQKVLVTLLAACMAVAKFTSWISKKTRFVLDRIVELRLDAVGATRPASAAPRVAAEVEVVMLLGVGRSSMGTRLFDHADRLVGDLLFRDGVAQPLQREGVGGIVLERAAELGHGDNLVVLEHRLVAALQGLIGQLLRG